MVGVWNQICEMGHRGLTAAARSVASCQSTLVRRPDPSNHAASPSQVVPNP